MRDGRASIAALYASNTLGAVIGVLAIAFWLVPQLGLRAPRGVCVALNLLCAVASLCCSAWAAGAECARASTATRRCRGAIADSLAITGLLGIGYEVLVVRVLSQVAEDTVYTFAMLLAVYLSAAPSERQRTSAGGRKGIAKSPAWY